MKDFKAIVDAEMSKLIDNGPDAEDNDIKPFYDALLSNEKFCNGICNTMEQVATKFAGMLMTKPGSADELKQLCTTKAMAKPLLGLTYIGYMMGKAAAQAESMDAMFGVDLKEVN